MAALGLAAPLEEQSELAARERIQSVASLFVLKAVTQTLLLTN